MSKGHLRLCSLATLREHSDNYTKKLFAVRSPGKINFEQYGMIHVPQLSPSYDLFTKYLKWRKGIFTEKELIALGPTGTWFDLYTIEFTSQMATDPHMVSCLYRIEELLNQGTNILLVCFCGDYINCHRKLIGERISLKGYDVIYG